jgi:hypothetical protein
VDDRFRQLERLAKQGDPEAKEAVKAIKNRKRKSPLLPPKKFRAIIEIANNLKPGMAVMLHFEQGSGPKYSRKYIEQVVRQWVKNPNGPVRVRTTMDGGRCLVLR